MEPLDFLKKISIEHANALRRIVVYNFFETLLTLCFIWSLSQLAFHWLSTNQTPSHWLPTTLVFLALRLLIMAFRQHQSQLLQLTISHDLRNAALSQALRQPLAGISESQFSQQLTDHVEAVARYQTGFAVHRKTLVISCLIILLAAFFTDWLAGLIFALTAPLIPVFMILIGNQAQHAADRQLQTLTLMGNYFSDRIRNLFTLGIFQRQAAEAVAIRRTTEAFSSSTLSVLKIAFLSSAVIEFLAAISIALLALYIGIHLLKLMSFGPGPELTYQTGLFLLMLAPEFYLPLRQLSQHYHQRASAITAASALIPLFSSAERKDLALTNPPDIHASGINLAFPGSQHCLWQAVDFQLAAGECLIIRGDSGIGKSTLLKMLGAMIPSAQGQLLVASENITRCQYTPGSIAYSGQHPSFSRGTLRQNLTLHQSHPDETLQECLSLCDLSHLSLDQALTENGRGISGGEARRLSLARALLSRAPLILLDEPTAELDEHTEQHICTVLSAIKGQSTVVIATHSDALANLGDHILWLQPNGEGRQ